MIVAEVSLAQHEEKANASLASREAWIQAEVSKKVTGACRTLIKDHRKKLKLEETRFCAERGELKFEIDSLKKNLAEADE